MPWKVPVSLNINILQVVRVQLWKPINEHINSSTNVTSFPPNVSSSGPGSNPGFHITGSFQISLEPSNLC